MPLLPKKTIAGLQNCAHGGIDLAEMKSLGKDAADVLDFSVCTNPYIKPPDMEEIMKAAHIERYPDRQSTLLRLKLSEKLGIGAENILAGSGTTELIRLIALAYFRQSDTVLITGPTYGEYEAACRLYGARPVYYRGGEKEGFVPDTAEMLKIIRRKKPRAVFICNPNNPTGRYLPRGEIVKILNGLNDGLLIIDEAYISFVEKNWNSLDLMERGNVVIIRSMTKDYGIPGLRLGYAAASGSIIKALRAVMPPWNVNAVAQEVGRRVLENDADLRESIRKTREATRYLTDNLTGKGFKVLPSDTHFFLVKVESAPGCRRYLLAKGVMVRDGTSFGLPQYVRISPRTLPECRKLAAAFSEYLKKRGKTV